VRQRADGDSPDAAGATWLATEAAGVAANLALDEALLDEAHESAVVGRVVRSWVAQRPTVVLGSSSRAAEEVDLDACARLGVEVLRRPSGGLTVVLGPGCVMWSVITGYPGGAPPVDVLHDDVLDPLRAALSAAGRTVVRRGSSDLAITAADGDRKVSGNALRVRRHAVLYHGTLLDDFDLDLVGRVLRHPPREPAYRERRGHAAFLANLRLGRPALDAALRRAFAATTVRSDAPWPRIDRLMADRYAAAAWTLRR